METSACANCSHQMCTRRVPIFSILGDEELARVTALIVRKKFRKGEMILFEDSPFDSMIILHTGSVKAFRYTPDGKEQILYIFSEGDFFGEMNLLRKQNATYNAEALESTNICMIHRTDFHRLMREYPEIGFRIIEELTERLERMETMVQSLGSKDIESRVSMMLLEFLKKYGKPHEKGTLVDLPLSREGMANYIGVTRETVSRKLSSLQDEGILELVGNKKVLILDENALGDSHA